LKKCPSLKTLALSESKVSDLSVLKSLPSLKELSITKNPIINFEFLQDCKSLIKLNINGVTIKKEDSRFFNLPHLTSLDVSYSKINDDDFFTNFPELKTMNCGVMLNEINDLSFLKDLPNLTEFKCWGKIASLSPLENCKNLTEIMFNSSSLRDANFISYFPNIQTVDLSTCQNLVDIGFLEDSSSLKTLIIKFCAKVPAQQIEKLRSKGVTVVTS
jgi:Leucine-rich repeat (LRR) protein